MASMEIFEETPQTLIKCQLCYVSSEIHWNCLTCNAYLCNLCFKNIHSKISQNNLHHVLNLQDYSSEKHAALCRQVDLENMKCSSHENRKCISFCLDCQKAICFKCLREEHMQHQMDDVYDMYNDEMSCIKDLQGKVGDTLPFIKDEKTKLQQLLNDSDTAYDDLMRKIKAHESKMHSAVTQYAQNLMEKCASMYKPSKVKIKEELDRIEKNEQELTKRKDDMNKILRSREASSVLNSRKTLTKALPQVIESKLTIPYAEFMPSDINVACFVDSFGDLLKRELLELVKTYESDLLSVTKIVNVKGDVGFIGSFTSEKIQQIKIKDDKMVVMKEENIKVYDMSLMDNGDLLISSLNTELRHYTKNGNFKTYKYFSPLETIGVHSNKRREVIVGLAEPGLAKQGSYEIKPNSIRRVVVINQTGEINHSYEYDQDNQRLFMWPRRITTVNDNIYVIDKLNIKFEGRVVVLGYGGQVKWIYTGGDKEKSGVDKFCPYDITATTSGLILVSDEDNHRIHALSQKGDLVCCHRVKDLGIELPLGIVIDDSGYLWIGCNTWRNDKPPKAKLHKLKFT